jgi:5-methylcytosine-specific restriction endonuclease McrA
MEIQKIKCERCGFTGLALHIHHKDRNHKNNNLDNLEVLCANCHHIEHREEATQRILLAGKRKIEQKNIRNEQFKQAQILMNSMVLKADRKKAEEIIQLLI